MARSISILLDIRVWRLELRGCSGIGYPYRSASVTEFWRRWHMSLSFWLRDYVYIPLGGNRSGRLAVYRNLMMTMLLGGLWHGAAWNYVIWGLLHGLALCAEQGRGGLRP